MFKDTTPGPFHEGVVVPQFTTRVDTLSRNRAQSCAYLVGQCRGRSEQDTFGGGKREPQPVREQGLKLKTSLNHPVGTFPKSRGGAMKGKVGNEDRV